MTASALVAMINADPGLSKYFTAKVEDTGTGKVAGGVSTVGVANSFAGRFNVAILDPGQNDGLLTMAEILSIRSVKDAIAVNASALAALDLHLKASFGGMASFPSIQADLAIDWGFLLGQSVQLPTVMLNNIGLDLGGFLSGFAGGVLSEVDKVLKPIRPIINFLSQPVPVVSKLAGGDVTMLDLLRIQGGDIARAVKFIEAIRNFDRIVQGIPNIGAGKILYMGDAKFNLDQKTFELSGPAVDIAASFKSLAPANSIIGFSPDDFLKTASDLAGEGDDKFKLGFPLLEPKNVIGLFSGKVVDLFTLKFPVLELKEEIERFFPLPILPVVGVRLAGEVSARAEFSFGFDTFGIQQFQKSGNIPDIFNGFFVFDRAQPSSGPDIDEIQLRAQITAAGALDAGLISASVGGGLFAGIDFNLHDNNNDGKIRLVELLDNTLLGTKDGFGPIHMFDVDGSLDAGLFAEVTLGKGVFSISKHFNLAKINLFDFDFPRPAGEGVQLAQCSIHVTNACSTTNGTTLELNIGTDADRRNFIFTEDVAESYSIYPGSEPNSVVVEAFGRSQIYTGVTKITGDAGAGNDRIIISKELTIPVELSGGAGNDTLIGGSGNDTLLGGDGDDDVRGGSGNDSLEGGDGRDSIIGEAGDDVLRGGSGDDSLGGGDGKDLIDGDAGNDTILAGSGDDVVYAGAGIDVVYGESGNDTLHGDDGSSATSPTGVGNADDSDQIEGGDGNDIIWGGQGGDRLYGNAGNDEIRGGTGSDFVYGGTGNDFIYGGDGDDQLFGENSRDIIYGGSGNDLLAGGLGSDDLYGGTGNDRLYFNTENTTGFILGTDAPTANAIVITTNTTSGIFDGAPLTISGVIGNTNANGTYYAKVLSPTTFALYTDALLTIARTGNAAYVSGGTWMTQDAAGHLMVGGSGDDLIYVSPMSFDNTIYGDGVNDETGAVVTSTDGKDEIYGGPAVDTIYAGGGDDTVYAMAGNDYVDAGSGNDKIYASDGDDLIIGGFGNDQLFGEAGNDIVWGGFATETDRQKLNTFELPPRYLETEGKYSSNPSQSW